MTGPMMRTRQTGRTCRVAGHGSRCEVSDERQLVTRAQERRAWQREADAQHEAEPSGVGG